MVLYIEVQHTTWFMRERLMRVLFNSNRFGLEPNKLYIVWTVPKYVIASGKHSADSFLHKLRAWQPQGEKIATEFRSYVFSWAPLYFHTMLATLSYPWALHSIRVMAHSSKASIIDWTISFPLLLLQSANIRNHSCTIYLSSFMSKTTREKLLAQHEGSLELHRQ